MDSFVVIWMLLFPPPVCSLASPWNCGSLRPVAKHGAALRMTHGCENRCTYFSSPAGKIHHFVEITLAGQLLHPWQWFLPPTKREPTKERIMFRSFARLGIFVTS